MTSTPFTLNNTNINVLIAGRRTAFLDGVAYLLGASNGIEVLHGVEHVTALLGDRAEAVPNVVITAVGCGSGCDPSSIRRVRRKLPAIRFVAISPPEHDEIVIGVLRAGASACLTTDCTSDELILAVRDVHLGQSYLDPSAASTVIEHATRPVPVVPGLLTGRELAVLMLLARGGTNKRIARDLMLSVNTIKTRLARIYEKLEVSSRAQAVARGLSEQLIDLD